MLWLDIGAFCGYRRKMEIAESSLQFLVTVGLCVLLEVIRADFEGITARR